MHRKPTKMQWIDMRGSLMSIGNLCCWSQNLFHVATATALVNANLCPVQSLSAWNSVDVQIKAANTQHKFNHRNQCKLLSVS